MLLDIIFFPIPLLVDAATGNWFMLDDKANVKLEKE